MQREWIIYTQRCTFISSPAADLAQKRLIKASSRVPLGRRFRVCRERVPDLTGQIRWQTLVMIQEVNMHGGIIWKVDERYCVAHPSYTETSSSCV